MTPAFSSDDAANRALARALSVAGVRVELIGTGGGCDALKVTAPTRPGEHLLITAVDDPSAPLDSDGAYWHGVQVGSYADDEDEPLALLLFVEVEYDAESGDRITDDDHLTSMVRAAISEWSAPR